MLFAVTQSFTRPADTTTYGPADLVANSTTAASVSPLTWGINHFGKGGFMIRAARLYKSSATVTAASFKIHLFNATPGTPTNGDNGALGVASAADFLDSIAIDLSTGAFVGTGALRSDRRRRPLACGCRKGPTRYSGCSRRWALTHRPAAKPSA